MNVRLLLAAIALALVASFFATAAFAQNVEVTLEPLFIEPPEVPSGTTPYELLPDGKSVRFPIVDEKNGTDTARMWWGVYVESQSVSLESLRLSLDWTGDPDLIGIFSANVEGGILFGPEGYLGRITNPLIDPDNFESPVVGALDFGLVPGLLPSSTAKDLAALIAFEVSVDENDYTSDASYTVRVGVLQAGDEVVSAGGGSPTFNGQPVMMGANPASAGIFVPEPGTTTLLASGALGLGWLGRRRARALR